MRNLLLLVVSFHLVSCGLFENKSKSVNHQTFFYHGDLNELTARNAFDKKSFLTKENFKDYENFWLGGWKEFGSQSLMGQETSLIGGSGVGRFDFSERGENVVYSGDVGSQEMEFLFSHESDQLELVSINYGGIPLGSDFELKHYSLKENNEAFSFLVSFTTADGDYLVGITFISDDVERVEEKRVNSDYNYLVAEGDRIFWRQEKTSMDVCGVLETSDQEMIEDSLYEWQSQNKLDISSQRIESPYPFSDLNQHCVYVMSGYLFESDNSGAVLGITLPVTHHKSKDIIDSDIFIALDGHKKVRGSERPYGEYVGTIRHEIGHWLGLGHEFDGDYRSVMSYNNVNEIQSGDLDAIEALYFGEGD